MGPPSDTTSAAARLIELGLNRYGAGDLDGALLMWEEALAIDPDNATATSYIDYVRTNYDMLSGGEPVVSGDEAPFGIEEEPEYQIEISPGELAARESSPSVAAPVDAGWFDDDRTDDVSSMVERDRPSQDLELELELEVEPPPPPPPEVNFDDATREYFGSPTKPLAPPESFAPVVPIAHTEFESETGTGGFDSEAGTGGDFSETAGTSEFQQDQFTGGFQPEGTPVGFGNQDTEIRKRDLGFVQPTAAPVAVSDKPSSPLSISAAPTIDTLSLGELTQERLSAFEGTSPGEKTLERKPFADEHDEHDEADLLEGLPVPQRPNQAAIETQDIPLPSSKAVTKELPGGGRLPSKNMTKDLPDQSRTPARRDSADLSQAEVMMSSAATRDFGTPKIDIGAPTRELGLRPRPPSNRAQTLQNPDDDDMPTKQSDVRAIRDTAREQGRAASVAEATNSDIKLPFDPIEARNGQILDEIDNGAPPNESPGDQTRRRISVLLDRAVAWNHDGDPEKAVCAVELALNEDPNSAVAQKLITRHRDVIMSVMQSYLGNLERQPQLAKSLQDLQNAPMSPRAAFLLSRIDGTLTIDELLDVSGMPRLEAYRHLCQLYLRGVLR